MAINQHKSIIDNDLRQAFTAFTSGNYVLSEQLLEKYAQIRHADDQCLHLYAISLHQQKKYSLAIKAFLKVSKRSRSSDYYCNRGLAYLELNDIKKAQRDFRLSLKINAKNMSAYFNLGLTCSRANDYENALKCYEKVLVSEPDHIEAANEKIVSLCRLGQFTNAERLLMDMLSTHEQTWSLHHLYAVLLYHQGRHSEALQQCNKSLDINDAQIKTVLLKSEIVFASHGYRDAIDYLKTMISQYDAYELINKLAYMLYEYALEQHSRDMMIDALECIEKSLKYCSCPSYKILRHKMLIKLNYQHIVVKELNEYDDKSGFTPNDLNELGLIYLELLKLKQAKSHFALAFQEDGNLSSKWNLFISCFLQGNDNEAWKYADGREEQSQVSKQSLEALSVWAGESLDESSLVVLTEQGLGDEIMLAPLVSCLSDSGAKVQLFCSERNLTLLTRSLPDVKVSGLSDMKQQQISADYQSTLFDLPKYLLPTYRPTKGYLQPEPNKHHEYSRKYAEHRSKIAFSWQSTNPVTGYDRSMPFEEFGKLFADKTLFFIDFQHVIERLPCKRFNGINIATCLSDPMGDMDDYAAELATCDVVVTVDNTLAHYAGALGIKTFLLLPFLPDWRWQLQTSNTLWYQSVEIIRQRERGQWTPVIQTVQQRLKEIFDD